MAPDLSTGRAVVVGNGNVALDVARILVTDPDVLATTDIADHALKILHDRGVEEVLIVGRRGPLQAPFTTLELRELGHLEGLGDVDVVVDPADFADISDEDVEAASKTVRNNIKVLRGYAEQSPKGAKRRIVFRFRTSPIEIKGEGRVESIVLGRNELATDDNGRVVAKDTGEREEVPAQLVVRAVGYRGVPTPGLPFDEKSGTIPHTAGRVDGSRNEYVVGWIKRGPTGVIGSNKSDSQETVDTLVADLSGADPADFADNHSEVLAEWLVERQPKVVTDDHWKLIDEHERTAGGTGGPAARESDQRGRAATDRARLNVACAQVPDRRRGVARRGGVEPRAGFTGPRRQAPRFAKAFVYEMPHTLSALESGALSEWRATLIVRESRAWMSRTDGGWTPSCAMTSASSTAWVMRGSRRRPRGSPTGSTPRPWWTGRRGLRPTAR